MKLTKTLIPLSMVIILTGCTPGTKTVNKIPSTDNTLVVDLHTFMPSGSSSSADLVSITKTQKIADDFYTQTGVRIKWFTGKSLDGESDKVSGDYIKAIQNGKMPAIGFSWSAFKDRGYYMDISKYLDTPNEFLSAEEQELYPTWKSQFPDYVWNTKECSMADGSIISIPLYLNPGPATGWFYNKTLMTQNGLDVPLTWNEFRNTAMEVKNISDDAGPYVYSQSTRIDNWEFQFSIGPAFMQLLNDACDTNKDGLVDEGEILEGVLNGYFSPVKTENDSYYQYAQGAFQMLKDFYKTMLPDGWLTANAEESWSKGKAVLRQNGLWAIRAENGLDHTRTWKYGIFAAPIVSSDSANWLASKNLPKAAAALKKIETVQVPAKNPGEPDYTSAELSKKFIELYKPTASLYPNLMVHGIYDNKKVLENAVKFLKFLSVPKNVTSVCEEHQAILGGVGGSAPGALLKTWLQQEFPVVPSTSWPSAYTVTNNNNINKKLRTWVKGETTDAEFFQTVAEEQKAGAQEYKKALQGN